MVFEKIILADLQPLTALGWKCMIQDSVFHDIQISAVSSKSDLVRELSDDPLSLVILDYATLDIVSLDELTIILERFPVAHWVFCSYEFSNSFLIMTSSLIHHRVHLLYKESSHWEFLRLFASIENGVEYVCKPILEYLNSREVNVSSQEHLSVTEREILALLAQGFSSKKIALVRFISTHTVMTHRKNIFRKIGVNNVHEATKYALRAGLIELSDYYI